MYANCTLFQKKGQQGGPRHGAEDDGEDKGLDILERIRGFAYLARLEGAAALGCALKK